MTSWKQYVNTEGEELRDFYVEHAPVDLVCTVEEGMTRQEFKDECDINVLMAGYIKTGLPFNDRPLEYLDVSDVPDMATAFDYVAKAEAAFMTLKAEVRREFDNNAVNFVAYAQDPANLPRMREWGLAPPEKPVEQPPAPPVAAAPVKT